MDLKSLQRKLFGAAVLVELDQFVIKFAETDEEVEKALRLRYEVFNLEHGHGVGDGGIDRDEYDEHCLHLVIFDRELGKAAGTYRIHFGSVAKHHHLGLYAAKESRLEGIEAILEDTVEVGRSCVSPDYRDGTAVGLLWGAIAQVMMRSGCNHLLGCVSLETMDPVTGWALYEYLKSQGTASELVRGVAMPDFELEKPARDLIEEKLKNPVELKKAIPPLFKGYLRLGAKICSEPVLDREFGCIDFIILMDYRKMPARYWRHFCGTDSPEGIGK